jgi:hypothetical protein
MDLDEEILQRLTNTEDHLTERKSKPQRDQCTEAMVAFANSALANKPGILYVGVSDNGEVLQDKTPENWQHEITAWGNGCYPELPVIPRTLSNQDGKEFLAVVVPRSEVRPHFARPAFRRQGAKTIRVPQHEIDKWIAYRSSKVRVIAERIGQTVLVQPQNAGAGMWASAGPHKVLDCNEHWVTLEALATNRVVSHPLSFIELKLNDGKPYPPGELCLLVKRDY